jgi:hypothetical protein
MRFRNILHRPKGIILIKPTKIRLFSRQSGRGAWSLSRVSTHYSSEVIRLESIRIRWFS